MLWIAAIHTSEKDFSPIGTGVVIDERRVLTSAHVVASDIGIRSELWIAFPMNENPFSTRIQASAVRLAQHDMADLAVIELAGPIPAGVKPAQLRCPRTADLVGKSWWALGFGRGDPRGNEAEGNIGASLGYGWIRLDSESRYHVEPGFSGGGLWCPDYDAVVGVVGEANDRGDGRAITLHAAAGWLPAEEIRELTAWSMTSSDGIARAAWGWRLVEDSEADRHWRPRGRGVASATERGNRFRGRDTALSEIVAWLDRPAIDNRMLIITGSPGVGKSAVLGRVVTTADVDFDDALLGDDVAVRASAGSVACAVHAKGKTALDVATEIARAASAQLPERVDNLAGGLRTALIERASPRFNLIIDALDEASTPSAARRIITEIVIPMAAVCAEAGAQVVVGTRKSDDAGDLIRPLGASAHVIDLDDSRYFDVDDLAAYAQATLQFHGDERPFGAYQSDMVAAPVARRIAELADRNFLVAGLVARGHGLSDKNPISADRVVFAPDISTVLGQYLERISPVDGIAARDLLMTLAYAETPGFSLEIWSIAVHALLNVEVTLGALREFVSGSAANFLVESALPRTGAPTDRVFRLFHQALSDALIAFRANSVPPTTDEAALTDAFVSYGSRIGWSDAPAYLFRSLPGHAARSGLIDILLSNLDYIIHADWRRLIPAADHTNTPNMRQRVRLLRLTLSALDAAPAERLAQLTVTEAISSAGNAFRRAQLQSPYKAIWTQMRQGAEDAVLDGHASRVNALCAVSVEGRNLLASASGDCSIRLWDPTIGATLRTLEGHSDLVNAISTVEIERRCFLVTASADRSVRLWDPITAVAVRMLEGKTGWVRAVCAVRVCGRDVLATAADDGVVRLWDPTTGLLLGHLSGHVGSVRAVCAIRVGGRDLLASADYGTVRLWDPENMILLRIIAGHAGWVNALCAMRSNGRQLLVSAGDDGIVRLWDPASGALKRTLKGNVARVGAVCAVRVDGHDVVAATGGNGSVRIWNPAKRAKLRILKGHAGEVNALCAVQVEKRELLASGGDDRSVRLWDPASGTPVHTWRATCRQLGFSAVFATTIGGFMEASSGSPTAGLLVFVASLTFSFPVIREISFRRRDRRPSRNKNRFEFVNALCAIRVGECDFLASAGDDGLVRLWNAASGAVVRTLKHHSGKVYAVCDFRAGRRRLLASGGEGGHIHLWNPRTGAVVYSLDSVGQVNAMCKIGVNGQDLLAFAGADGVVRVWEPLSGVVRNTLDGHTGWVRAMCAVLIDGRNMVASAADDGSVRIWDPSSGVELRTLYGHTGRVNAVCAARVDGRDLIASAADDGTVRLWDPTHGTLIRSFEGHSGWAVAVCNVQVDGRDVLASAGVDGMVRVWDPAKHPNTASAIPVHSPAKAISAIGNRSMVIAVEQGMIATYINEV